MKTKCPWPKGSKCEALWDCKECLQWYYSRPWWWRLWDGMFHGFAKEWQKLQW